MEEFNNSHRQRLIVVADDFGVSPRANRNILYLISLGKINRVAVMAHGKISSKEIDELSRSGVKIDIHLDILHKFHLDRSTRLQAGALSRGLEFVGKLLAGQISNKKIAEDWESQIKKFHELFGRYPDGVNSHEHVHFFPLFFKESIRLQQKYSIPYVRFGKILKINHHLLISYILRLIRFFDRKTFEKSGCVSSQSLASLDWIKNLDAFLENLPEGTVEIACRPELAEDFEKIKKYF